MVFITHTGGAGEYQDRETGILYNARPGRLEVKMLSVPVEGKGFKKGQ
jgi:hypothetical protein